MEISIIGTSSPACNIAKADYSEIQNLGFCRSSRCKKNQVWFDLNRNWSTSPIRLVAKPAAMVAGVSCSQSREEINRAMVEKCLPENQVQLFVGLPLDTVSDCNTIRRGKAIAAGLKALKLLGCQGVEVPVWWGIAEKEAMGKYEWSGYLALAKMVQDVGLKLRVSICFHGSKESKIQLPVWISKIGETQPDIFFTDRSGIRYKECLSLGVDEIPVLEGKSPMHVYRRFLESFKSAFDDFIGSTITDVAIGLGPNGELRYPSSPSKKPGQTSGAGEFQCYDKHMLHHLKQHAEQTGNFHWGLGGPHDAPKRYECPTQNSFFKENGGSWQSPYGDFFLSWYSSQLISHGERLLSLASTTFSNSSLSISGKIPFLRSWYKMSSHPSEVTAGHYNTITRDGYDTIAEMFARNSCRMIVPGLELSDKYPSQDTLSSPELLLSQIKNVCRKHGVKVYGENERISDIPNGLDQIKKNIMDDTFIMDVFTYQRMGAHFFSPDHFPSFMEFVRCLNQPDLHSDDMPEENQAKLSGSTDSESESEPGNNLKMQKAY